MHVLFNVLFVTTLFKYSSGIIYYLNESEYNRMPPVYHLDDYDDCLQTSSDVYCTVSYVLVSDEQSELLDMIEEYSEHTVSHYNHTKIRDGICVRKKCQPYEENETISSYFLESCLNYSTWRDYKLKTNVKNKHCYSLSDHNISIDTSDITVAVLLLTIITVNIIGTLCCGCSPYNEKAMNIWPCFSLSRNWKRLVSNAKHPDERLESLKAINGIRAIILFGVITVHCIWPFTIAAKNSHDVELFFYSVPNYILINGSVTLQSYLVISGFLMSYKMELQSEKSKINWTSVPKSIILRYFRLTPVYAVTLALVATWSKFAGPSPLWDATMSFARTQCRTRWWQNLLYINNYFYDTQCIAVAWYLGADMHMFILGVITCVALSKKKYRTLVLTILFAIGLILPAVHIYIRDLQGLMMFSPAISRSLFKTDPSFNEAYKMSHMNMASYIVGLMLGYLVYSGQQSAIDVKKITKFRYIVWAMPALQVVIMMSGSIFYRDAPKDPAYIRALYGALSKPLFAVSIACLMYGLIFKIEKPFREFFELSIWVVPSRLSYCMYIIHLSFQRIFLSMSPTLLRMSLFNMFFMALCLTMVSFVIAIPMWLFIEAPFIEFTKYCSQPKKKPIVNGCHTKRNNENTTL